MNLILSLVFLGMLHGIEGSCCVTYGYGAMMKPCCYKYADMVNASNCVVEMGIVGQGKEHYPSQSCAEVQDGCCVTNLIIRIDTKVQSCCHTYEDAVLPGYCVTRNQGELKTHYSGQLCSAVKEFTACERRQNLEKTQCGGMMGCFITQCEADGSFTPRQCHGSIGNCWCVDDDGKTMKGPAPLVDSDCQTGCCESFGLGEKNERCCQTYEDAIPSSACTTTNNSVGGGKIHHLGYMCQEVTAFTPCERKRSEETFDCAGKIGCSITQCDKNGMYEQQQCSGSTGYCHCLDLDGNEISGSSVRGPATCDPWSCNGVRTKQLSLCNGRVGCKITQCESDGSFSPIQCHGSTGYCWCANDKGQRIGPMYGPNEGLTKENCQIGCCVSFGYGAKMEPCCHEYQENVTNGSCVSGGYGGGVIHSTENTCAELKIKFMTPCEKKKANDIKNCGGLGCYETNCEADGSFSSTQCYGSVCWCVDKSGQKIEGTDTDRGTAELNCKTGCCLTFGYGALMKTCCQKYEDDVLANACTSTGMGGGSTHYSGNTCEEVKSLTDCENRRLIEGNNCNERDGCFITQCLPDGSFNPSQCHPSTGDCWCVDGHGKYINATKTLNGERLFQCQAAGCCVTFGYGAMMKPCCHQYKDSVIPEFCMAKGMGGGKAHYPNSSCEVIKSMTECEKRRNLEKKQCDGRFGCMITQCEADGSFRLKQCNPSTGYCWCVGVAGQVIKGTEIRGTPKCAIGCCWVMDSQNNTIYSDSVLESSCTGQFRVGQTCMDVKGYTPCQIQKHRQETLCNGMLGCKSTQCSLDGSYTPKQCSSDGYCWCVDSNGNYREGSKENFKIDPYLNCSGFKTPCEKKMTSQCEADGTYSPKQCLNSNCHCVDKQGNKIEGTETPLGESQLNCQTGCCMSFGYGAFMKPCCHKYEDNVIEKNCVSTGIIGGGSIHYPGNSCIDVEGLSKCNRTRNLDTIKCGGMPDCFVTKCEDDGSFSPKQCLNSICWCVDENGNTISNNRTNNTKIEMNCMVERQTECEAKRTLETNACAGNLGCQITQCEPDGTFSPIQCHAGFCWCVDTDRKTIPETLSRDTTDCKAPTNCQTRRSLEIYKCGGRLGCFISECTASGEFNSKQCHGSTGYCWCVNAKGEKIESTFTSPGENGPDCMACADQLAIEEAKCGGFGCYKSNCVADCCFSPKQCHGSVCWCTNYKGKAINQTYHDIHDGRSCTCERQRSEDEAKCGGLGCFKTRCEVDGFFSPQQCHGSKCWCVDSSGNSLSLEGSRDIKCETECFRAQILDRKSCGGYGCRITQCEPDGSYSPKQCHGSECWCVKSYGTNASEIAHTRHSIGEKRSCLCERQRSDDEVNCGGWGCFKTQCEIDGSFSPQQCLGSQCWCVDSDGEKVGVEGSRTLDCYTPCLVKQHSEKIACDGAMGCKITQCEPDGSFSLKQCHGSVCYCVASNGVEIKSTTFNIWETASCECARQRSDDEVMCGGLGCFKTQCEVDGSYSPKQCHGSQCWCVDSDGKRLGAESSRYTNCETLCLTQKASDMANCGGMGCKITQCESDGSFSPLQCFGSVCYCVDLQGRKINGTTSMIGQIQSCVCPRQQNEDKMMCKGAFGCFETQCEADGTFSPKQCHGSECWCIDENNKKIGIQGDIKLECGVSCIDQRATDLVTCGNNLGCFLTKCEADGSYSPLQCLGDMCWCVDSRNIKIFGTERTIGTNTSCAGTCEAKHNSDLVSCGSKMGCFITQCAEDGSFNPRQCHGSKCWCVDSAGTPISETEHHIYESICQQTKSACELKQIEDDKNCGDNLGCFRTSCEADGSYSPKQCLGSKCWCVDGAGIRISEIEHDISSESPCQQTKSACELKQIEDDKNCGDKVGCFRTRCEANGSYSPKQCHGSICWCVDGAGTRISETEYPISIDSPCQQTKSACELMQIEDDRTSCEADGSYSPKQCHEAECWCVNTDGKIISGTQHAVQENFMCKSNQGSLTPTPSPTYLPDSASISNGNLIYAWFSIFILCLFR